MFICDISVYNRYGKQTLDEELEKIGLKWHDLVLLLVTGQVPGIEQSRLIPFLQTDKANVTKLIQKMEQTGYLYREQNKEDKRNKKVFLTKKGTELLPELYHVMNTWEENCFAGIDPTELEVFQKVGNQITKNIMKHQ